MARVDSRRHAPPVRIGRSSAAVQNYQMVRPSAVTRLARAAGNFGQREARFASVPMRLRVQVNAGPNSEPARQGIIPIGVTQRKRGYPAITELPSPVK